MASSADDRPSLRELAREEPEAVRAVAEMRDDELREWLLSILEDVEDDADGGGDGE